MKPDRRKTAKPGVGFEVTFFLLDIDEHMIETGGHVLDVPLFDLGSAFVVKEARLVGKGLDL